MSVISDDNFCFFSLTEIKNMRSKKLRDYYIEKYFENINILCLSKAGKMMTKCHDVASIDVIVHALEEYEYEHTSEYFFPGCTIEMYEPFIYRKTFKPFTCPMCASYFFRETEIAIYKPFIWNITNNDSYVLKRPVKVDSRCSEYLPTNIRSLDQMQMRMDISYETNDDQAYSWSRELNGGFSFVKLKRK